MTERMHRDWQSLARSMVSSWTPERASAVKAEMVFRLRRRRQNQKIFIAAASILLTGVAIWAAFGMFSDPSALLHPTGESLQVPVAREDIGLLNEAHRAPNTLSENSPKAIPLLPGTRFSVEEGVAVSTFRIVEGSVRFETRKQEAKKLIVHVGEVTIEDIGTVFTVEAISEMQARVAVTEGRILVTWPSGRAEIDKGEEGIFPPQPGGTVKQNTSLKPTVSSSSQGAEDWRTAARQGDYQRAFRLIDADPTRVLNRVEDLLLAADVMRLGGRSNRAVGYLDRVVDGFPQDPRASLAAFTLGRVFLDELGRPRQAANAFATAAGKNSPLAEEASAREVEAWFRAGETDLARAAALRYLHNFPKGARIDAVKAFGGIKTAL